jgi:hypothetical protein
MEKVKADPIFEARSLRSAPGWYVRVSWRCSQVEHVGGFASDHDAQKWIEEKSEGWLRDRVSARSSVFRTRANSHFVRTVK